MYQWLIISRKSKFHLHSCLTSWQLWVALLWCQWFNRALIDYRLYYHRHNSMSSKLVIMWNKNIKIASPCYKPQSNYTIPFKIYFYTTSSRRGNCRPLVLNVTYFIFIYCPWNGHEKKQQDLNLIVDVLEWQTIEEIIQRTWQEEGAGNIKMILHVTSKLITQTSPLNYIHGYIHKWRKGVSENGF